MFGKKKKIEEIEEKLQTIRHEKEELLKIKEMLDDVSPKIDISDIYVWQHNNISYIVRQYIKPIVGNCLGGAGPLRHGFESTLVDIFNNNVIYKKSSKGLIDKKQLMKKEDGTYLEGSSQYAYFNHILDVDRSLLVYPDKKVPLYVLQQTYYKLNNIDITEIKMKSKGK
ncbi:MAG: hypothetical protein IJY25_03210 [Bacilli bacterium]|nr:hypothetical protein [Bacilli bacterium]